MNRLSGSTPAQSLRHEPKHLHYGSPSQLTDLVVDDHSQSQNLNEPSSPRDSWEQHNERKVFRSPPAQRNTSHFVSPSSKERDIVHEGQNGGTKIKAFPASREATVGTLFNDASASLSASRTGTQTESGAPSKTDPRKIPKKIPDAQVASSLNPNQSCPPPKSPTPTKRSFPPQASSPQSRPTSASTRGGIRRLASTGTGHTWTEKYHISVPSRAMTQKTDVQQESVAKRADTNTNTNTTNKELSSAILDDDFHLDTSNERGSAMMQVMQDSNRHERSVSRGRTHMDKSIEATVKKPETGANVRSRKASHMMGIFDSKDQAKRTIQRSQDTDHSRTDGLTSNDHSESPAPQGVSWSSETDYFSKRPSFSKSVNKPTDDIEQPSPSTTSFWRDEPVLSPEEETPRAPLPQDLLQEIRDGRPQAFRNKASTPGVPSVERASQDFEASVVVTEHHDDEEEHISAAVYYPHEGLSADEIEDLEHHVEAVSEERSRTRSDSLHPSTAEAARSPREEVVVELHEEHIDISVESNNEKRIFHGTLKPTPEEEEAQEEDAQTPRMPAVDNTPAAPASVVSESDLDSSDEFPELSTAEEGTSTPLAKEEPVKKDRRRAGTVTKPKTAVTLAPYKHQVGGHSTIFRFSRRAVCKQLNNQENEFYERVEQSHPDMLKFMPRYIGVLNVTFSKGAKQAQDNTASSETETAKEGTNGEKSDKTTNGEKLTNGHGASGSSSNANPAPRIVSHSQQTDSIAQVLLDQNRHLLTPEYGIQRPKSADPTHFRQRAFDTTNNEKPDESPRNGTHNPIRPSHLNHSESSSWGISSINDSLKAKVFREVFGGAPQINVVRRHTRHSHASGSTLR